MQTQFGPKDKFRFVYETGQTKDDGTPWCVWSAPFTPSYHENSALRPFLRKWLGRELTAEELKTFDTEDMLGKTAHITVIHEHSDGEVYANIALIQPDKSAEPLKPSGKFVRMKDRPPKDGNGYRRAEQASGGNGDLGATKIHVGKCKGLEVRDLSPEQVGALIGHWLPAAKANAKPSADDRRLIAALEAWQAAQKPVEDDNVPY
ncbi:MAG TPA: hypothetical protein PK640_01690 [Verrucomicrobiota bacterium]|nr:hypothetical protein [Verrucomicrobiota bacterium]